MLYQARAMNRFQTRSSTSQLDQKVIGEDLDSTPRLKVKVKFSHNYMISISISDTVGYRHVSERLPRSWSQCMPIDSQPEWDFNPYVAIGGGYFTTQTHFLSCCCETAWNCDTSFSDFLPRDAMLSAVYAVVVCLCVCVSVCHTPVLYQNG